MTRAPSKGGAARDLARLQSRAERQLQQILAKGAARDAGIWQFACEQLIAHCNPGPYQGLVQLRRVPVTIEEFVASEDYLGDLVEVWPALMPDLQAMNPDVLVGEAPAHEILLGGATGTGKTTLAQVTTLYQLYFLCCFRDPQGLFGLSAKTPIVFLLQSVTPTVTNRVIYQPLRQIFEAMPFVQRHLNWNRDKQSCLEIEGGIHVVPELANVQAMTGQAVIGGILDEVNFMVVVESSKRTPGPRGQGGRYDQAEDVYRNLSRRRKSRFTTRGISIGSLSIISSTRYKDDFLDRRMAEVARLGEQNVVVVRHKQYDVAPQSRYSGETFRVQVGDQTHPTRVLEAGEDAPESARIELVPEEYLVDFQRDPENALRDIIGIATDVISPFMRQRHKIVDAVLAGRTLGLQPWVDKADVALASDGLPQWNEAAMPQDRTRPRFVHVDMSLTRDRCGIAIVKWSGHVNIAGDGETETVETLPSFEVESAVSIQPSGEAELIIGDLRCWLIQLVDFYGFNIKEITFDGFQSRDTIQALRKAGIRSRILSVDRDVEPYEYLRRCFYQGRIAMVESELLRQELAQLEFNAETQKIDHPPRGSKDLADAVCGAVYAAGHSRQVRAATGYRDQDGLPTHTQDAAGRAERRPRPRSNRRRRVNRKQQLHDDYRDLLAQEDEDFRKRYG